MLPPPIFFDLSFIHSPSGADKLAVLAVTFSNPPSARPFAKAVGASTSLKAEDDIAVVASPVGAVVVKVNGFPVNAAGPVITVAM